VVVRKDNFIHTVELVFTLVQHEHRDEVDQLDGSLLVEIDLSSLDLDKFVTDILIDVKHDLVFEHVVHHVVILSFKQD
jgi:hypothetical protein